MTEISQELMTIREAGRWFRRSASWMRQQRDLLRVAGPGGQPLYHVRVCRAYIMGKLTELSEGDLRRVQIKALADACGLSEDRAILAVANSERSQAEKSCAGQLA